MSIFGSAAKKVLPPRVFHALRVLKSPQSYFLESATYDQNGLISVHNSDFLNNDDFKRAYQAGERTNSWSNAPIHWRVHVVLWAAARAVRLEGDLVECGVNRGGFSRAIIEYIDFPKLKDKKFYLLDTFEGLSDAQISDEERENIADYKYEDCYGEVKNTFEKFENVRIIKGVVPDTLPQVEAEKVSFLSIDMNCAAPEIAAAEYFWEKLTSGAAMVLDDYGWAKHIVQKRAFDEFAKRKNVEILSLPTGQALILKP